jgi:hypothetical protein
MDENKSIDIDGRLNDDLFFQGNVNEQMEGEFFIRNELC